MCVAVPDVFCGIVASKNIVNSRLRDTILESVERTL